MDKKILTIIVLSLILISIAGVFAYNYVGSTAYQQGVQDANLFLNQQIQLQLEQQGYLVYNYPSPDAEQGFVPIKLGVIRE